MHYNTKTVFRSVSFNVSFCHTATGWDSLFKSVSPEDSSFKFQKKSLFTLPPNKVGESVSWSHIVCV